MIRKWRKLISRASLAVLTFALVGVALSGCFGDKPSQGLAMVDAGLQSPDIIESGALHVGIDYSNAPFAGMLDGRVIGIDVDIAAAMAEQLGLRLELHDINGQDPYSVLQNGTVDVVMNIQGDTATGFGGIQVGPYLVDGPAIFAKGYSDAPLNMDPETLVGVSIAAQEETVSAYQVTQDIGPDRLFTFATLEEAFAQLDAGINYVAADAIVGSFLAVSKENVRCERILGEPQHVNLGVVAEKQNLASKLSDTLRKLRDEGAMEVIVAKWLGPISTQIVLKTDAIMVQAPSTGVTGEGEGGTGTGTQTQDPAGGTGTEEPAPVDNDNDGYDDNTGSLIENSTDGGTGTGGGGSAPVDVDQDGYDDNTNEWIG